MQYIFAPVIYPVSSAPVIDGVLVLDRDKRIKDILKPGDEEYFTAFELAEKYEGIICPGFINAHCHLELSYLKGKVAKHTGLHGFVKDLMAVRKFAIDDEINAALEVAENEMLANGIVAVGDISNHNFTFAQKAKRRMLYYTFIELFGLNPDKADEIMEQGVALYDELQKALPDAPSAIAPHATYSLSLPLLKQIAEHSYLRDGVISIHNQETEGENEFFKTGTGPIAEQMARFGLDLSKWKPTGFNAMPSTVVHLPNCNKIILVHNTVSTADDVEWANNYGKMIFWCLCPNANLYIENKLPDVAMLREKGAKILIGTDSLASNDSLSVLDELKTIATHFPNIPAEELIQWATLNGAEALGFKRQLGSFDKGKTPGVNLISVDENGKIFEGSKVLKIA